VTIATALLMPALPIFQLHSGALYSDGVRRIVPNDMLKLPPHTGVEVVGEEEVLGAVLE